VVGARPQFIKAAALSRALRHAGHEELLLHTGQHYDHEMSQAFFDELGIPAPRVNLEVGSGTHAAQTAKMLVGIEAAIMRETPKVVVLFGDTNSTLAGALAAAKLNVPTAHVEAGLRSFNPRMPEEINRVVTDRLAALLFAPSEVARKNLAAEGIVEGVEVVGDIMADALADSVARANAARSAGTPTILQRLGVEEGKYVLVTIHRAESTTTERFLPILDALERIEEDVIMPIHPRTRALLEKLDRKVAGRVRAIGPVGHSEMVELTRSSRLVVTDSGGLQKEAYWLSVPCVTVREETEWIETVSGGWNVLTGTDPDKILDAVRRQTVPAAHPTLYGDGCAAARCVTSLERAFPGLDGGR
jgi:UDP-N-acetylglucosamine 2-epimerase